MWTTLGLLALSLAPAQGGDLELTNIRSTYGFLGPARPDQPLLPGDVLFVTFDIDNVQTDKAGRILYSLGMEVTDAKGKTQYKQEPRDLEGTNSLGGHHLPAFANVELGLDQPPGQYTLKVTVTDRAAKKSKSFERAFQVLPKSFGLVRVGISADPEGKFPVPAIGATGEPVWLHYTAVGFERGGEKKEPNMAFEMQIADDAGQPVLTDPVKGEVKQLPSHLTFCPFDYQIVLNRPGKFTLKLKATDEISKKSSEVTLPITVVEQK